MSKEEFIGYAIVFCLPILSSFIALVKPIINLNVNIQKLNDSIKHLNSDNASIKVDIEKHESMLHDHETRLSLIEHREG